MRSILTAAAVLFVAIPAWAYGQVVRGTIRDEATNSPLRGAFIVLSETAGRGRVAALTDTAGRFVLRGPAPGHYQLNAQLIGYSLSAEPRFSLAAGETRVVNLGLSVSAVPLDQISVRAERRCGARSQSAETARLWEEARKALDVAVWTEQDTTALFRVRTFEQQLSRALTPVSREEMNFDLKRGTSAFETAPVDSLIEFGFVQKNGDQHVFFGPDAALLTSNAFLEQHCFWVERSSNRLGLVGLAFEPLPRRRVSDIRGALWLDQRTGALRFVDYAFVNTGANLDPATAGGRTEYQQLPNGAWIVSRWEIRMPASDDTETGTRSDHVTRVGGEVLDVRLPDSETTVLVPSFALRGIVYDSVKQEPLARARVHLPGTPLEGYSDNIGQFRIDSVPRGTYYITFDHARLDSLPLAVTVERITVDSTTGPLRLATPNPERLLATLCDPQAMANIAVRQMRVAEHLGALRVIVRDDATGGLLRGATVTVQWNDNMPAINMAGPRALETRTNEKGEATICGVPVLHEVRVIGEYRDQRARPRSLMLPRERLLQITVRINVPRD
jgi:hypothetical protein